MNEELTREALELMKRVDVRFISESVVTCMGVPVDVMIKRLATALLAEMDKPKVWDSIHTTVDKARIIYYAGDKCLYDKEYTRELPKTRARQIAEEIDAALEAPRYTPRIEVIEKLLAKYAEELEGKE